MKLALRRLIRMYWTYSNVLTVQLKQSPLLLLPLRITQTSGCFRMRALDARLLHVYRR